MRTTLKSCYGIMLPVILTTVLNLMSSGSYAQSDSIILRDIKWDAGAPAGSQEIIIPSGNALLQGFLYKANGAQKHPTLILLHGYPGNERNLDLAQAVRSKGWNVIYFNYRGSWGSPGQFSLKNCVQDAVNTVKFAKKFSDSLRIDTANIVLFGHSMGAWVCLKALAELPEIKKAFALSTFHFYPFIKDMNAAQLAALVKDPANGLVSQVLNTTAEDIFVPVLNNLAFYNLQQENVLANKQLIMLDEHNNNKELAAFLQKNNTKYFEYSVWQTDHGFTNKRISLINKLMEFLEKE